MLRQIEKVEQLPANNLTIPQDAIASLLQRLDGAALKSASLLRGEPLQYRHENHHLG
jgi:hypothetical protein